MPSHTEIPARRSHARDVHIRGLEAAISDVRLILVAVPAFAHGIYAKKLAGVVRPGQIVVVLPGTFGSLMFWCAFREHGVEGVAVAETNTPLRNAPARPRKVPRHEPL